MRDPAPIRLAGLVGRRQDGGPDPGRVRRAVQEGRILHDERQAEVCRPSLQCGGEVAPVSAGPWCPGRIDQVQENGTSGGVRQRPRVDQRLQQSGRCNPWRVARGHDVARAPGSCGRRHEVCGGTSRLWRASHEPHDAPTERRHHKKSDGPDDQEPTQTFAQRGRGRDRNGRRGGTNPPGDLVGGVSRRRQGDRLCLHRVEHLDSGYAGRRTCGRIGREAGGEDISQPGRHSRTHRGGAPNRRRSIRRGSRETEPADRRHRIDVGGRRRSGTTGDLGSHEALIPIDRPPSVSHEPGHPNITDQWFAVCAEQNASRCQITVHDPGSVQRRQRAEQRREGRDRLTGAQARSLTEKLGQTAASDPIENQGQLAVGHGHGTVLTNQMLVLNPAKHCHQLNCCREGLGHITDRDDPQNQRFVIEGPHGRPGRPLCVRAQLARDGETRHERRHGDGNPYCLDMATDAPTILATSGGYRDHDRLRFQFADLLHYAVDLSGTSEVVPRVCNVGTASGDDPRFQMDMSEAGRVAGFNLTHLSLFSMPNLDDIEGHLMAQDVVWVNGGSVANLLAVWRVHGLDQILRRVWQAGVVLAGVSAGSICWYEGGTTDSFGPELRAVTNGLGFLPYANGVHYDSEDRRRPLVHRLVADGTLGTTHCTDDGVGMLYRGTELVEAVSEQAGKGAYIVRRDGDHAVEERLETRLLRPRSAQTPGPAATSVTWQG